VSDKGAGKFSQIKITIWIKFFRDKIREYLSLMKSRLLIIYLLRSWAEQTVIRQLLCWTMLMEGGIQKIEVCTKVIASKPYSIGVPWII